ncbi:uncharacterized protein K452DRAFT_144975 [Aplosporella prunicola CBS 121167]|uniref:Uncharacterized protein n=1 Tax=Aplosporella prunicola CBS 121167 TaxID=1176127 RepID=A0A6A6BN07_9PEZI|nr:uncharacterized protein K452DRAFT_144975 [Aplosporella prunicola CBS 121167]KAF2144644.1 hypothetical protein K452DRAFT_144975 [Aplosporella prunicola CBS 121167]
MWAADPVSLVAMQVANADAAYRLARQANGGAQLGARVGRHDNGLCDGTGCSLGQASEMQPCCEVGCAAPWRRLEFVASSQSASRNPLAGNSRRCSSRPVT